MPRPILFPILLLLLPAAHARADTLSLNPSADNTLYEDVAGSVSNATGNYLFSGLTLVNIKRRALLRFDLSTLPASATITSATLTLTMSRGGSSPIPFSLHRVTRQWGEATSQADGMEGTGAAITPGDAGWLHSVYPKIGRAHV